MWDPKKGVALLNDCKYGHDIAQRDGGTLMRLTLVKSATLPDPNADQGLHEFRYSLLPVKPADLETVIAEGYQFNRGPVPVRLPEGKEVSPWKIPVHVEGTLLLETVKQAEDGSGVVLRYYESFGWTGEHKIVVGKKPKSVRRVTILERDAQEMDPSGRVLKMKCRPFEIVTLIVDWS